MKRIATNRAMICLGLLAMAVAVVSFTPAVSADNAADEATYVGHNQCQVCHNKPAEGAQWNMWKEQGHARAYEQLKTDEAIEVARAAGLDSPPVESPECLRCHVTAYDYEAQDVPAPIRLEDGVQCESCHGASSKHIAIGRQVMFGQVDAGEADIMAGRDTAGKENCLQCHNEESPTWREDRYTLEDGTQTGFDFEQAFAKIAHPNPQKQQDTEE